MWVAVSTTRVDVNDNGGNDAGSVTALQGSLDSVRAVGRVHHTEAANITDIRVPGRRRSKAVPLELSDCGCQVEDKELESRGDRSGLETEALPAVRHF